ncbi:MAG: hemolysin family protein [Gemmataceae bacterium]|nr:hemolysin family protein [Gemmataceae bacterium]
MATVELIVIVSMIAFNGVFAAYEIALAASSMARLHMLANENRSGAKAALYMKENVEGSLAAIQIGITLCGAVAAATGGAGAGARIEPWLSERYGFSPGMAEFLAVLAIVLPLTAFTIMFGELVPKVFALRNKEWICLALSPWLRWFTFSVWPAVWFFETVVTAITDWGQRKLHRAGKGARSEPSELQEMYAVTALARTARLIGQREERIILGAARLTSRPISEIMLPASAISMLDANGTLTDGLVAAHLDMHTRFPVTGKTGDPQAIVGYVNVKDIVAVMRLFPEKPSLRSIIRPLPDLRENDSISAGLERLLRDSNHIALVRDEAGSVVGLVTLEDIVEELLGDIRDEYDRLPAYVQASGPGWVVAGGISLARLREQTGVDLSLDLPAAKSDTLNDWFTGHLGRAVRGGDAITRSGVRVTVRKVRRQQLLEAQVVGLPGMGGTHPAQP